MSKIYSDMNLQQSSSLQNIESQNVQNVNISAEVAIQKNNVVSSHQNKEQIEDKKIPELDASSKIPPDELAKKLESLEKKLETVMTLVEAKERASQGLGDKQEVIENIEKSAEKMSKAKTAGRFAKVFGWIATIASVVVGSLMIATGAGAVIGGLMLAGAALKIGMEVAHHNQKAKEWMEKNPAFGYTMLGLQFLLALAAPIIGFTALGASHAAGHEVPKSLETARKVGETTKEIKEIAEPSEALSKGIKEIRGKIEEKEKAARIQAEIQDEKNTIHSNLQRLIQELSAGLGEVKKQVHLQSLQQSQALASKVNE